ncbi:MAG: phosphate transport system regulatory protein PhoU [Calditrichaeota bacterium]|nr:MAG: phosphate transport system regulatory protein PhoU [Calditrichota bacterium]MBL1207823.1 phosphate transport system regulatory protein PhoU [Calditrichota bacterium]NOG47657.1 phosphate signaling complex protein PhoU [Calditrichota bacterium]
MKEKFIHLLDNIKKDLIFLANEVEHNIRQSIKAFKKQDIKLAEQVIAKDNEVDDLEVKIEENILALLALQQPVAIDLRFIVGGLKMNNDLERIGDHAANIAQTVLELKDEPVPAELVKKLNDMKKISCSMLHDVVSSFIHQDADDARDVLEKDEDVDNLYDEILKDAKELIKKDVSKINEAFGVVRAARSLERVGDLSTNIAEDVVFMKDAKIIRHGGGG